MQGFKVVRQTLPLSYTQPCFGIFVLSAEIYIASVTENN
jgi:hypothetical protein